MNELGALLAQRAGDVTSYSYGTVTAGSPLTVRLDSEETAVQTVCASTYSPVVNDRVLVLVQGADRIVITSIGAPTGPPSGSIMATIAATAPTGYLFLDGSTVTGGQTLYPSLWAVIPAGWKSGANIVLPDARGRTIIGAGTGAGLTARTLSSLVGAETHQLTVAEMPAHNHTTTITAKAFTSALDGLSGGTTNNNNQNYVSDSKGGNAAHNNMQPSIALNWMVRT